jgi:RNA polymerase sigma factor (sigma-70 family)
LDRYAFMRACRNGGAAIEQALRQLDRAYFAVLMKEAERGLRDRDAAYDLVQDTFIRVWQRCATFRGGSELLPWIKSILRHQLLDRLRVDGREVPLGEDGGASPEVEKRLLELAGDTAPSPEREARQRELDQCFRRCWQRFVEAAPSHALVISWIAEDGLSHEEVAALLERTPGATREFISQCRKRARVHLDEWYRLAAGME